VAPAAATPNATASPALLQQAQLNDFMLTELYNRSPHPWCGSPLGNVVLVPGFSPAIHFPPHPPAQLPYFSRVMCYYSQRKQLIWSFLVA